MLIKKMPVMLLALLFASAIQPKLQAQAWFKPTDAVKKDPTKTIIHTLKNGLKVYISVNKTQPRIQTMIAVRAGSKYDPAATTGLAHYLEHLMFKGTRRIGTKNWQAEKKYLDKIAVKFEEHKNAKSPAAKKQLYKTIDKLSYAASKFAIANEYDKMVSSLGAKGTNAFTANDMTVYMNDIPANELKKWLMLERERFSTLVLRLFHTELETVYEEFNRTQDNDRRKVFNNVLKGLFPNHPYGMQTTIGKGEHLKNPSMYNIQQYFATYYRPNNIAICLSGDLEPDKTIALVEQYFGDWQAAPLPAFKQPQDSPLTKPVIMKSYGPQPAMVYIGYKFKGAGSKEALMLEVIDMLLANSQAGLIDLDLNLTQKVLAAGSFPYILDDYSVHFLYGMPKRNQTVETVKALLLQEIEKIKNGEFDDWLVEAVINNLKLERIKTIEKNRGRGFLMVNAFIFNLNWNDYINKYEHLEQLTKKDILDFANKYYQDNYVVSYKLRGKGSKYTMPKPEITQLELDRKSTSVFFNEFAQIDSAPIKPQFTDFAKDITRTEINKVAFSAIKNRQNELFSLTYIFPMGTDNGKLLPLAITYLPYLGTAKYSARQLKQQFFRLGLKFSVSISRYQLYVKLSGLNKNLKPGVKLLEHLLANVVPDAKAYKNLVGTILKSRANAKLNKSTILRQGLISMAKYGMESPFRDKLSTKQLAAMDINKLTASIRQLTKFKHQIFYYGPDATGIVAKTLTAEHAVHAAWLPVPSKKIYPKQQFVAPKVYYVPYDMQQVEIFFLASDIKFDPELLAVSQLFNEYFGAGLSSITFQEIREKRALAYSAYSWYSNARKKEDENYLLAYVGTQSDKLPNAVAAMMTVLNKMPQAELQFNAAKAALLKKIASSRVTGEAIFWQYEAAKKRGLDYDINRKVYERVKTLALTDLNDFFQTHIKGKKYALCVMGNERNIKLETLKKMGKFKKFTLRELFGY